MRAISLLLLSYICAATAYPSKDNLEVKQNTGVDQILNQSDGFLQSTMNLVRRFFSGNLFRFPSLGSLLGNSDGEEGEGEAVGDLGGVLDSPQGFLGIGEPGVPEGDFFNTTSSVDVINGTLVEVNQTISRRDLSGGKVLLQRSQVMKLSPEVRKYQGESDSDGHVEDKASGKGKSNKDVSDSSYFDPKITLPVRHHPKFISSFQNNPNEYSVINLYKPAISKIKLISPNQHYLLLLNHPFLRRLPQRNHDISLQNHNNQRYRHQKRPKLQQNHDPRHINHAGHHQVPQSPSRDLSDDTNVNYNGYLPVESDAEVIPI